MGELNENTDVKSSLREKISTTAICILVAVGVIFCFRGQYSYTALCLCILLVLFSIINPLVSFIKKSSNDFAGIFDILKMVWNVLCGILFILFIYFITFASTSVFMDNLDLCISISYLFLVYISMIFIKSIRDKFSENKEKQSIFHRISMNIFLIIITFIGSFIPISKLIFDFAPDTLDLSQSPNIIFLDHVKPTVENDDLRNIVSKTIKFKTKNSIGEVMSVFNKYPINKISLPEKLRGLINAPDELENYFSFRFAYDHNENTNPNVPYFCSLEIYENGTVELYTKNGRSNVLEHITSSNSSEYKLDVPKDVRIKCYEDLLKIVNNAD